MDVPVIRTVLAISLFAACGSKAPPSADGPVYTPRVSYALHGIAPDCTVKKTPDKQYTCSGRPGTVTVWLGTGDRLRHIEIRLISMTLPQAKAHLVPALTPVLDQAALDAFVARLAQLASGDRATLELAGAHVELAALGKSRIAPEYAIDLEW
jgi:hypothetical protein